MTFPERLKKLRLEHSLTQSDVANILQLTDRGVRKYESGDNQPTLLVLIALADYFDVSLDYLVGRSNDPKRR